MMAVSAISVEKEYEKLGNVKPEHIKEIMAWLATQPHLPHKYITELEVIVAHHSCAYDIETTKRVIDTNYTLKTLFPFYQNRKMDERMEMAFQTWLILPLKSLTKKGYKVIYCELLDADPNKFVYADVVKAFLMVLDLWQHEEGTVPGVALIVNCDRVTVGHVSKVDLRVAQQFFYFLQEAMFVCLKEFHFINAPSFIDKLLALVRPFMKEDLLKILKVYQADANCLDDYISVSDLMESNMDSKIALKDEMCKKLKANEKFFEAESKQRVDESKRPGGPKNMNSFFPGIEESFKNLEID